MSQEFRYKENDRVVIDAGYFKGEGIVCGSSTVGAPIIGRTYLIKITHSTPMIPNEEYPFSVVAIFEVHLKLAPPYEQPIVNENGVMPEFATKNCS